MAVVKATEGTEVPLSRLGLNLVRYYLGNRWALLVLGAGVLLTGIALNWSWLVAAGIAPILLSTLPCLVMCGLGLCMLCRSSEKQSTPSRDAADAATSSAPLAVAKMDNPAASAATCCHEHINEAEVPPVKQLESISERST